MPVNVNNLSKQFGKRQVLKNVHFSMDKGEIVGFFGPNGAGKTKTMRIIAGVLPYSEGSVKICGMEVLKSH